MRLMVTQDQKILNVRLSRPEAHNALDSELIKGLTDVFKNIHRKQDIVAVKLSGEGPSFCAGGDLNWMKQSLHFTLSQNIKDTQKLSDMYEAIFQCPVPVLGEVHGNIMGGGVGLTAVCDIVAAETASKFCLSEVKLGLVPSIISPYLLKKVPESLIRPLMLTAELFTATHAKEIQLVHFVGNSADCAKYIDDRLNLIVSNAPEATRITKNLITQIKTSTWKAARALTVKTIAQRRVSSEGQEGISAFFEKRKPKWRNLL